MNSMQSRLARLRISIITIAYAHAANLPDASGGHRRRAHDGSCRNVQVAKFNLDSIMNSPLSGAAGVSRRAFLKASLAHGAVAMFAGPALIHVARAADPAAGLCVTICNHWSYIGIGWQLGIESCVLSATDAMELADRPPHAKTCLNLDARAYEFMAEKFPEVATRLRQQLAAGKVELIGGTYGQPMGTTLSGESNIRQMVIGREVIRKALGYEMVTFLEEEEFTHPQVPQLAALAGFRYASLAQLDTWGRAGCPRQEFNVVIWKGMDGTMIRCVPKNSLFGYAPDLKKLVDSRAFKKLQALARIFHTASSFSVRRGIGEQNLGGERSFCRPAAELSAKTG